MVQETAGLDRPGLTRSVIDLLGPRSLEDTRALQERMGAAFDGATEADFQRLLSRIETTGDAWGYHPPDPIARQMSRAILQVLFAHGSALHEAANLEAARKEPVIFLANHLSFADANDLEYLMAESGYGDVAERLTALAGPKVYTRPLPRFASLCFGTLKTPQSQSRATDEARMSRKDVARIAADVIRAARIRQEEGDHLLIFVEGTRSRTGSMQRGLAAVSRYLTRPARLVIPIGIWGSEHLIPLGAEGMHSARVEARVGTAIRIEELFDRCEGRRPLAIDTIGFRIAELLPPDYRGSYGESQGELYRAHEIALELGGSPSS
jgi:1-acyl-sn-glycerol-3-phosphate acyltransferase